MMNLIVVSDLTTNEGLYFRYLTMFASMDFGMDVLVETQKQQRDHYFNLLREKGLYDYVAEIVAPEEREEGIRLDTEMNYPFSVTTQKISASNVIKLIVEIQSLVSVKKRVKRVG